MAGNRFFENTEGVEGKKEQTRQHFHTAAHADPVPMPEGTDQQKGQRGYIQRYRARGLAFLVSVRGEIKVDGHHQSAQQQQSVKHGRRLGGKEIHGGFHPALGAKAEKFNPADAEDLKCRKRMMPQPLAR